MFQFKEDDLTGNYAMKRKVKATNENVLFFELKEKVTNLGFKKSTFERKSISDIE